MDEIHIDQLKTININVKLKNEFLKKILDKIKEKKITIPSIHSKLKPKIPLLTFKSILKPSYNNFRPLWLILDLCKIVEIDISELEKNVISYRTKKGRIVISKPKLPIKITPVFDMIISHIMGDGHCFDIEGRDPYFGYIQSNNELLLSFLIKVESVFGKIDYSYEYFPKSKKIHIPSSISCVMMQHYGLKSNDFLENNSRLPSKILNKKKEYLLGVLIAFIIDEGHIDSSNIVIGMKNKKLLEDLKFICKKLNYNTKITSNNEKRFFLYILSDGVKSLWDDYLSLKEIYPEINLGYKEKLIFDFILRKNKEWRTFKQGECKNRIIEILNEFPRTIIELSKILEISRQGVKYHLNRLKDMEIVEIYGTGYSGSSIFKLKKYHKFPVKNKGRCRQYDSTNNKILYMLKNRETTTIELSKILKMSREAVYNLLLNLENKKKIIRLGKENRKILWGIKKSPET
ncbi:MAG: ArsR family transcriptional regulator [Candidatus Aenigmarchaeota archaeon]|nr:ArsR family transcriptional regulator [Candidatus Aenigmarchaeota archaeon]